MLVEIAADDSDFRAALVAEGLPVDDLATAPMVAYAWCDGGEILARAGVEGTGPDRLLRSLVVAPTARGRGLTRRFVAEITRRAAADGTHRLWLLTTTAAPVFDRLGWRRVAREDAPVGLAASRQFAALCPASAVCMMRATTP